MKHRFAMAVLGLGVLLAGDAILIAPYSVELTTHGIAAAVTSPLTIVHLSDLHTTSFGRRERAVAAIVEESKPDLIVVTGDVVDTGDLEPARPLFERLHAPLGVFVVNGNWEHWTPPRDEAAFYRSVGATLLVNEGRLVRPDVWLAGVDDGHADFVSRGVGTSILPVRFACAPEVAEITLR